MIVILILTLYREAKHNFPFCMHSTFNSIRGKMLNNAFRMFVIIECNMSVLYRFYQYSIDCTNCIAIWVKPITHINTFNNIIPKSTLDLR